MVQKCLFYRFLCCLVCYFVHYVVDIMQRVPKCTLYIHLIKRKLLSERRAIVYIFFGTPGIQSSMLSHYARTFTLENHYEAENNVWHDADWVKPMCVCV